MDGITLQPEEQLKQANIDKEIVNQRIMMRCDILTKDNEKLRRMITNLDSQKKKEDK